MARLHEAPKPEHQAPIKLIGSVQKTEPGDSFLSEPAVVGEALTHNKSGNRTQDQEILLVGCRIPAVRPNPVRTLLGSEDLQAGSFPKHGRMYEPSISHRESLEQSTNIPVAQSKETEKG